MAGALVRSRLTAIPHFVSWAEPNHKRAPASARSRSNHKTKLRFIGVRLQLFMYINIQKTFLAGVEPATSGFGDLRSNPTELQEDFISDFITDYLQSRPKSSVGALATIALDEIISTPVAAIL